MRAAAVLAVLPLALAGCGTVVDHKDLESKLSSYLQLEFGSRVDVACPSGQSAGKGKTFSCTATAPGGKRLTVRVRMQNDKGGFTVIGLAATPRR